MKIKSSPNEGTTSLRRVMYVEDEDDNWEIAMLLLKGRFSLLRARNAREACDVLRNNPNLHAVLMDIQLSGSDLDGIQLTELIRGSLPAEKRPDYARELTGSSVPIIFMTGYGSRYPETTLLAKGGDMLMTKPVDFTKLTLALASISFRKVHTLLDPQGKT